jgi:hypothetical protein
MLVLVRPLILALLSCVPLRVLAEAADASLPRSAPASRCASFHAAGQELDALDRRIQQLDARLALRPTLGAVVGTAVSGVGFVASLGVSLGLGDRAPGLWALPALAGAGVITGVTVLGVRAVQRQPEARERGVLKRRRNLLDGQTPLFARKGCDDAHFEQDARALLARMQSETAALSARRDEMSRAGPRTLIIAGGVTMGGLLFTSFLMWVISRSSDYPEESYPPEERRLVRALAGASVGGLGLLAGGLVWSARTAARRLPLDTELGLRTREQRRIENVLTPQLSPTSAGLTWSGRF